MTLGSRTAIAIGLACAAVAQFIALMLAGAGHGWITAFYASAALWLLMPTSFALVTNEHGTSRPTLVLLLLVAAVADIALVIATANEGSQYFKLMLQGGMLPFTIAWIALWSSWQFAVLIALVRPLPTGSTP